MKGKGEEAEEDETVNAMIIKEEPKEGKAPSLEFAFTHAVFGQNQSAKITTSWILLDNCSSVDIFANKDLLTDIHLLNETISIYFNARITKVSMKGTLYNYGLVWYHPHDIANILSLSWVKNKFPIKYSSSNGTNS